MLVFATTTTVGVKVGKDVQQTPSFEIGYSRQEAAFVPLLANTRVGDDGRLEPCPAVNSDGNAGATHTVQIENCHFRATHDGQDKDSYSTLASFGSKSAASANGAESAIAQYFATGIAAQHLALTGGANIVQAGGDTKAKAESAARAAQWAALAEARVLEIDADLQSIGEKLDTDNDQVVDQAELDRLKMVLGPATRSRADAFLNQPISALLLFLRSNIPDDVEAIEMALSP